MKKRAAIFIVIFHILFVVMLGVFVHAIHGIQGQYVCPIRVVMGGTCSEESAQVPAPAHFFKSVWYVVDLLSVPFMTVVFAAALFFLYAVWRRDLDSDFLFGARVRKRIRCFFIQNCRWSFERWLYMRRGNYF